MDRQIGVEHPAVGALVLVAVVFVAVVLVGTLAGSGLAQEEPSVRGEPELSVYAPDATVTPGTETTITLQVVNDGDVDAGSDARRGVVTTARGVVVEVERAGTPLTVETGEFAVGSVGEDAVREVPVRVSVPADAEPGRYELDVRLRYGHTYRSVPSEGVARERSRTTRVSVPVTVEDAPRFEIRTTESDVQVGGSGAFAADVTNVGGETARDLSIGLSTDAPDLSLSGGDRTEARIDRIAPGATVSVRFPASVRETAVTETLGMTGTVRYTGPDGVRKVHDGISVGLRPAPEQSFSIAVENSSLRVGENGTVRGTIGNDGPADAHGVVVAIDSPSFVPRSPRYAVGDLAAGQSGSFTFRGAVPASADAVPQQIAFSTSYRTAADDARTAEETVRIPVAERRDAVDVTAASPTFAAGESGTLRLDVTNGRDVPIRDVELRLAVEPPLESEFRTTVVPSLAPGETGRVAFDLDVDGDAPASQYPATVSVDYTDPEDRRITEQSAIVAVAVTDVGGTFPAERLVLALLLIVVSAGAWWYYGR
ncbi:hypothetical protein EXE53_19055 [Halorubrum sp. SD626R]|uniref:COG1361 S-layer family protein n=1 Tax=Halorubrum sp. SD626R TaxID=1419722 RepID=UPI0010FA0892|nr:NEW3 domain-containing protein [Halorubrum sp. SD626R]TKX78842.1 hypothetical protein EXE53_19055 [Halorubrum sp. SD626R]